MIDLRVIDLRRMALAELIGTAFLVMAVIGSGIMASRLSPGDRGLQLLENSTATGAALVALILMLGPVSAAFNPVVTVLEALLDGLPWRTAGTLILSQLVGGLLGAVAANVAFGLPAASLAQHHRDGGGVWFAEAIATFGLLLVIFGVSRNGRGSSVAVAVGGYIAAAYWFTSSTSFANPAVTVARMLSDSFAGISPASAPMFVLMQAVGGAAALVVVPVLWPTREKVLS